MESLLIIVLREFKKNAFLEAKNRADTAKLVNPLIVTLEALPFIGDNMVNVHEPTFVMTNTQYSVVAKRWFGGVLLAAKYGGISNIDKYDKAWGYRLTNIAHWYQLSEYPKEIER